MSVKPSFFAELKRRHVYKIGAAYAVGGWLLVQVATQVFPFFGISNAAVKWTVLVIVAGLPIALVLAWLFDVTADGIVRTESLPAQGETPTALRERRGVDRKLNYVLGTLVLIGLAYFVAERTLLEPRRTASLAAENAAAGTPEKSIAVLPLANSTGDAANEYFSDGISEELIAALARIGRLKVIGRTSAFQFKGRADDSRSIGEKLGVRWLLEGSVRKSVERVRISVELVNAGDGASVWSETYDREFKEVLAVQSDIARAVAEQLKVTLLGGAQPAVSVPAADVPPGGDLRAYTALLQGNFYGHRYDEDSWQKAVGYYEEAIRLDPGYAKAHASLGFIEAANAETFAFTPERKAAALARAREAVDTALRLAPDLADGHGAEAYLLENLDFDLAGSRRESQRAHELEPQNPGYLAGLAYGHLLRGEYAAALELHRRAVALEPLDALQRFNLALNLVASGQLDEAETELLRTLETQPSVSKAHMMLATIAILRGDGPTAIREAARETDAFWRTYALALAHFQNGERAPADAALAELVARYADGAAGQIAMVHALRGDADEVFRWLDHGVATRDPAVLQLYVNPFLSRYRRDPRFAALCHRLGLPESAAPATT